MPFSLLEEESCHLCRRLMKVTDPSCTEPSVKLTYYCPKRKIELPEGSERAVRKEEKLTEEERAKVENSSPRLLNSYSQMR